MLTYFTRILSAMVAPAELAYTTIIYPTKDVPVVVHDGLGIAQERPSYRLPVAEQNEARHERLDARAVDEELEGQLTIFEGSDAEDDTADVLGSLKPGSISAVIGLDDYQGQGFYPYDFGSSASLGDSDISTSTAGFLDVNPASGLPMMDACFDVGGNLYGMA